MEKRIRRLGVFMILCFLALFIQLNNIQVLKANSLANDPKNPRIQLLDRSQTRGSILSSDGTVLASSVLAPPGSIYKYQRVYPANTATLFAQIIGFDSSVVRQLPRRRGRVQQLPHPAHPAGQDAPGSAH